MRKMSFFGENDIAERRKEGVVSHNTLFVRHGLQPLFQVYMQRAVSKVEQRLRRRCIGIQTAVADGGEQNAHQQQVHQRGIVSAIEQRQGKISRNQKPAVGA